MGHRLGRGLFRVRSRRASRADGRRGGARSGRTRPPTATCASIASIDAARRTGADAVHPGYGFLAENEDFAPACRDAGLTFIGPSPEAIALMGSKTAARRVAIAAGVPVVPGTEEPFGRGCAGQRDRVARRTDRLPDHGQGGRRRRRQGHAPRRQRRRISSSAIRAARSEAGAAFGDSAIYLERRLLRPRHIEVQLLGDRTAPCCRSSSANARSSGGIRK